MPKYTINKNPPPEKNNNNYPELNKPSTEKEQQNCNKKQPLQNETPSKTPTENEPTIIPEMQIIPDI